MNNEIETLYPVKKKNNKVLFLILVIVIIGIVAGFALKANLSKEDSKEKTKTEEKTNNNNDGENKDNENKEGETISEIKNYSYKCVKPQLKSDNYTLDYEYYFLFENDTLASGYTNYIYKFNSLEAFNAFKLPNPPNTELKEERNDPANLMRIINLNSYYPQEENGDKTLASYIKMLESKDYTCEIN